MMFQLSVNLQTVCCCCCCSYFWKAFQWYKLYFGTMANHMPLATAAFSPWITKPVLSHIPTWIREKYNQQFMFCQPWTSTLTLHSHKHSTTWATTMGFHVQLTKYAPMDNFCDNTNSVINSITTFHYILTVGTTLTPNNTC